MLLLGAGIFLPSILGIFAFASIKGERDLSPFYFAAGTLITVYGVVTGKVASISPINRDLIVEAQADALLLTESTGYIIDANTTAKELLGDKSLIGRGASEILQESRHSSERFRVERSSRIWEFRRVAVEGDSALLVGRDVTEQASLESERDKHNAELEQKVLSRTLELKEANESLLAEIESRRSLELVALENAAQFRAIFDNSAFLLARLDQDGRVLAINRSATEVTQVSSTTAQGLLFSEMEIWKQSGLSKKLADHHAAALNGRIEVFELLLTDPMRRVLDCRMKPFQSEAKANVLFESQDVTALRELDESRAHLQTMLAHADRMDMLGRLAGGVAHDFNNLLTVIIGAAEILQETASTEESKSAVEEILTAGEQASLVTRQLLAFSRIGGNTPIILDAHTTIGQLSRIYDRLLGEKHFLELNLTAPLATIEMVPGHLEQCLTNLVVNARDAMPNGGAVRLETTLARSPQNGASGAFLRISVIDHGTGMAPATRDRIFDAYFTTKAEGKGTGLGLHTVHTLVAGANGFIRIESEEGAGSTFALYFPIVDAEAAEQGRGAPPSTITGSETLLLVEDLVPLRERTARELRRLGYDVHSVDSAKAALLALSEMAPNVPAALITDVMLPGEDGIALGQHVRKLHHRLPVIFTTGYAGDKELIVRDTPRMYLL
jgi:signal transduction histidine kinase/CheY-like chemotaxis protein